MKYKMGVFRHTYSAEQYHVSGVKRVENEQNSGILRITRHKVEISPILRVGQVRANGFGLYTRTESTNHGTSGDTRFAPLSADA